MTGQPATRTESSAAKRSSSAKQPSTANQPSSAATTDAEAPPSEASVRRSLRALANGEGSHSGDVDATANRNDSDATDPEIAEGAVDGRENAVRVVDDARSAVSCALDAAAFLADGGLDELDDAIAVAARHGATDAAERGRSARATLRRLDDALNEGAATQDRHRASPTPDGDGGSSP